MPPFQCFVGPLHQRQLSPSCVSLVFIYLCSEFVAWPASAVELSFSFYVICFLFPAPHCYCCHGKCDLVRYVERFVPRTLGVGFCMISLASSHPVFPFSFFFKVYIIVIHALFFFDCIKYQEEQFDCRESFARL